MLKANYTVDHITSDDTKSFGKIVFIIDNDGPTSITNDAEAVVIEVLSQYPNHRIIYRDTDGNWDELIHRQGEFVSFKINPKF